MDQGRAVDMIHLGFHKAFDTTAHNSDLQAEKLWADWTVRYVENWLDTGLAVINGSKSSWQSITRRESQSYFWAGKKGDLITAYSYLKGSYNDSGDNLLSDMANSKKRGTGRAGVLCRPQQGRQRSPVAPPGPTLYPNAYHAQGVSPTNTTDLLPTIWTLSRMCRAGVQRHRLHLQCWGCRCRLGSGGLLGFGVGVALAEAELRLLPAWALQTVADSTEAGQPRGLLAAWVQRWDILAHVEKLQNVVEKHKQHAGGQPGFGCCALVERRMREG
ncbi:hypothetical protein QYF61_026780 [Mycteria americana]|uniref:Uncharacterized protein n=1 Tax=Mycteria americana TaxID=33587 RepID=A0AAN7NN15_MYCAM|nr:hypothetical protein QYF61_026780 [Mycteria americana]